MSSMADLAAALGGGAAPPPGGPDPGAAPPGLGPSPDLGGGPAAPMDDSSQADASSKYTTSLEALQGAEDALHAFIQLDPDDSDRAEATKALQVVIKLQASNSDAANQGSMSGLQRALQGGPAANNTPMGGSY